MSNDLDMDDDAASSSPHPNFHKELGPRNTRHRALKAVNEEVSIITCKDGTGIRYVTDIRYDASQGLPFSWSKEEALVVRKDGVVDDLARALARAWPTMKFSVLHSRRRVVR